MDGDAEGLGQVVTQVIRGLIAQQVQEVLTILEQEAQEGHGGLLGLVEVVHMLEQGPLAVLAVKQLAGLLLSLGLQQAHDTVRLARKNYDNYLCNSQFSSSHNRVCLR